MAQQGGQASLAQLQEQVQLLLNQVRHLNQTSDQQAARLQEMSDYEQIKIELVNLKQQQQQSGG